ncbi:MAG TPA: hypothetical protein VIP30_13775 [Stenotrophomonas sp.]|jgi:Na+-translocating ferredoxin:NAD+ oxidoreductase RNF subunit RnfB
MSFNVNFNPSVGSGHSSAGTAPYSQNAGLSSGRVAEILAKILEKQNKRFESLLNKAQSQMGSSAGQNQGNVAMIRVQQAMGQVNTVQSVATSAIQGLTDAQKETARATR